MLREQRKVGMEGKEDRPQSSPVFTLRTQRRAAKVHDWGLRVQVRLPRGSRGGASMIEGEWASKQLAKNPMGQRSLRIGPFDITREAQR